MSVQEKIESLKALVSEEVNEERIVREGRNVLQILRNSWKKNREEFSAENLVLLKEIAEIIDAITRFIEEQEDFEYILSKEEVDEVVGRLYSIVEKLDGLKVSGRVNKEIRDLMERKATLPSLASSQRILELKRAVASLNSKSPTCKKCGRNMILREGNGDYFWGCSAFPKCWGKKRLTEEELNVIPD